MHHLYALASRLPGLNDPNPAAPPGVEDKVNKLLGFLKFGGIVVAVIGLIMIGASWMISHRNGDGDEKTQRLLWWGAGAIMIGSAVSIAGWVI